MSTSDQNTLLRLARAVLSKEEYEKFIQMLADRESRRREVREDANIELAKFLPRLESLLRDKQKEKTSA